MTASSPTRSRATVCGRSAGSRGSPLELRVHAQLELRRGAWLERGAQRGLEPTADDAQRQREEARERCGACGGGSRSEAEG